MVNDKSKSEVEATILLMRKALMRNDIRMLKILNQQLFAQINKIVNNYGRV